MTVPANLNRVDYTGTGSAGPFTVPFPFFDTSHLTVLQTDALFNQTTLTGWTATGAGGPSGTVTLAAACPVGSTLTIMRIVPLTQITSIKNQEAFFPEVHEQEMDLLAMADQQLDEAMDRTLRLPAGLSGVDMTLPRPDPGHSLVWNAGGTALENAGVASATLQQDFADSADVAKGDAMIAVKQPFTGAVARTQHDKNTEWVSVLDFGADPTGTTDSTAACQAALVATRWSVQGGNEKKLLWNSGEYLVSDSLVLGSKQYVEFEQGVKITLSVTDPIENPLTALFVASGQHDITLIGNNCELIGDRAHAPAASEGRGSGIGFDTVNKFCIKDFKISDFSTDGIEITGFETTFCQDGIIENVVCNNNRRNGLSIISVKNLTVIGGLFKNSNGTPFGPWVGIDIEPNGDCTIENVNLIGVNTSGNNAQGIMLTPQLTPTWARYNVNIFGGKSLGDNVGENAFDGSLGFVNGVAIPNKIYGSVIVKDFLIEGAKTCGVYFRNWDADKCPHVTLENITVLNPGSGAGTLSNASKSGFVIENPSNTLVTNVGNITCMNCRATDNRTPNKMLWGFYLNSYTGYKLKNIKMINCYAENFTAASKAHVQTYFAASTSGGGENVSICYDNFEKLTSAGSGAIDNSAGLVDNITVNGTVLTLPPANKAIGTTYIVSNDYNVTYSSIAPQTGDIILGYAAISTPVSLGAGAMISVVSVGNNTWIVKSKT